MGKLYNCIETLELDKILEKLADLTCCETAYNRVMQIKPIYDINYLEGELEKVDQAFILISKYGKPAFGNIQDPQKYLKKATAGGVLSITEILNVGKILKLSRGLRGWKTQNVKEYHSFTDTFKNLIVNKELETRIFNSIISPDEIADDASEALYSIRKNIQKNISKIRDKLDEFIKNTKYQKYLQESIVTIKNGRYVVPVRQEYKSEIPGLVHDTSSSGSTLFIEPMKIVEINNNIKLLQNNETEEIERILQELSHSCSEISENIIYNFDLIIKLNIYFAKAELASQQSSIKPEINNYGQIFLKAARHPLIDTKKVVPITIELGIEYDSLVITGPNTGGKTVALKTVGLMCMMVMCGLLIPVKYGSKVSVFENILVDIGDKQSIENDLSTFSSHMTNIIDILGSCNNNTLVILDELGSGTDPIEGAALAIAIIDYIKNIKRSKLMVTTHYSEIKVYALQSDRVENACFEINLDTLSPTYNLVIGSPGKSNAFIISKKLGLPDNIIQLARQNISTENKKFDDIIESLEKSRKNYNQMYEDYSSQKLDLELKLSDLDRQRHIMETEKKTQIEKAKQQANDLVSSVRAEAGLIIEQLEMLRKQQISTQALTDKNKLKSQIDKLFDKANPVIQTPAEPYVLPRKLKVGDSVKLRDIDKDAIVVSLPDKSGNLFVQIGIIKSKVKVSNVRLLDTPKIQFQNKGNVNIYKSKLSARESMELDLRGHTTEEALIELDQFISNCLMNKVHGISIIHGKGTGVLRAAVHKYLKQNKYIKTFRLGNYGEGDSGITIAEL